MRQGREGGGKRRGGGGGEEKRPGKLTLKYKTGRGFQLE